MIRWWMTLGINVTYNNMYSHKVGYNAAEGYEVSEGGLLIIV